MFNTSCAIKVVNASLQRCPKDFPYAYKTGEYCCKKFQLPGEKVDSILDKR